MSRIFAVFAAAATMGENDAEEERRNPATYLILSKVFIFFPLFFCSTLGINGTTCATLFYLFLHFSRKFQAVISRTQARNEMRRKEEVWPMTIHRQQR